MFLERKTKEGESPVGENNYRFLKFFLSTVGNENLAGSKLNYQLRLNTNWSPIVN